MKFELSQQIVDYTKHHISGSDLQPEIVKNKFALWDKVVEENLLSSPDEETRNKAILLLDDDTIYEYAFFENEDEKSFEYEAYQDIIAQCKYDFKDVNDPNRFVMFVASNQIGKLIRDSELVSTPTGWKKNGELKIGDYVFGSDGKQTKVLNVNHQKNWKLYKITFDDGSFTHAGLEHLWKCKTNKNRFSKEYTCNRGKNKGQKIPNSNYGKWQTLSTEEIIKQGRYTPESIPRLKVSTPVTKSVDYPLSKQILDPYFLGLILGDGSIGCSTSFTTGDEEIAEWVASHYEFNFVKKGNKISGIVKNTYKEFKKLGLRGTRSHNKFIPKEYLITNIHRRISLLRGLMDTDGSVYGKHSTLEYCTISEKLKDDFVELVNSLGGLINKVSEKKPFYYNAKREKVYGKLAYSIRFKMKDINPFFLKRKANKWKRVTKYKHERLIEKIEFSHYENATCIVVDNKDHTYLVSKNYIVTHNSRFLIGKARKLLFTEKGKNIVIVTNNLDLTKFMLSELKGNLNTGKFANSWREDVDDVNNTTMLTIKLTIAGKEYTNRLICRPAGEGSLGYPIHYLFLDELDFYEDGKKLFWKVFFPRLNKTKGQCLVFSNPNPDIATSQSVLHELWIGDLFKRKFTFNFLDASWNTEEELEVARRNSPGHIFASTHLGQWSEDGGAFLSGSEISYMMNKDWHNHTLPMADRPVHIGLDLGKMRDNTVFSIGISKPPKDERDKYNDLDIIYQEEVPLKTTYERIVERYAEIKQFYDDNCEGVAEMGYDATGQKTFMDILNMKGVPGTAVDFSTKKSNKTLLYNDFKMMAENKKLKCAWSSKCEKQLVNLQFKYTKTKQLQFVENKTDNIHDDFPDSMAILIHIAVKPSRIIPSAAVIGSPETKDKPTIPKTTHESAKEYYAQVIQENNSFNRNNQGGQRTW